MEAELKIIDKIELAEKEKYTWKICTKMFYNENIYSISGLNKNDRNDFIVIKIYKLNKINKEKVLEKIITEFYFTFSLKPYEYFPKQISGLLSKDNEYLFLISKENTTELCYLIKSIEYNYLNNQTLIKWIIYQIAFGLYILHSNNIIHHNIKSSNILINSEGGIRISDFSCSIFKGEKSYAYTLAYASPEFLIDISNVDEKFDMWGLGVIMLELFCKKQPILGDSNIKNRRDQLDFIFSQFGINQKYSDEELKNELNENKNIKFEINKNYLEKIKDDKAKCLLKNLLVFDPKKRFSAKEVLDSEYLAEYKGIDPFDIKPIEYPIDYKEFSNKKIDKNKFIEILKIIISK